MSESRKQEAMRAEYDGRVMTVELWDTANGETETLDATDKPHQDFVNALTGLRDIFLDHMELPDLGGRCIVTGLKKKDTKDSYGFVISAIIHCPGTHTDLKVKSSTLTVPVDGFFDEEDQYGFQKHDPDDYLWALTDDEIEQCEKVLEEAYLFAREGKRKEDGQLDMFKEAEKEGIIEPLQLEDKTKQLPEGPCWVPQIEGGER